jgi:hypothetical protein
MGEIMRNGITRRVLMAAGFGLMLTSAALAQQQPPPETVRVRGTIDSVGEGTIMVTTREGAKLTIKLADNLRIAALVKATLADVNPGMFVGAAAIPQPDGTQRALELHIFSDAQRGVVPEGFRPWDLRPNTTMTNAIVDAIVVAVDGHRLTLKYKDGEKIIIVPAGIPIAAYAPGKRDDIKPGAGIFIGAAAKQPDGTYTAGAVNVGRDIPPPM